MYVIAFYCPVEYVDQIKNALFAVGAGTYKGYEQCAWQTEGEGQFRPLSDSHPFIGTHNMLEKIKEVKVEMICADELLKTAVEALIEAHPYEEPAYHILRTYTLDELS